MKCHDGENIDEKTNNARYEYCPGEISHRVLAQKLLSILMWGFYLHLFDDEIQIIPAGVGEEAGVE